MKNILIFGGSGGIGSAIVTKFATQKEYNIIFVDINENKDLLNYNNVFFEYCDVTDVNQLIELKKNILTNYGKISHLISLAGLAIKNEFYGLSEMTYEDIQKSVSLNLISHINICKTFIDSFTSTSNQSISLVSSINAIASFGLPAYSASKAGLIGLMMGLVQELGEMNVRINTFSLGTVVTEATTKEPKNFDEYLQTTKIRRFTSKTEVAQAIYSVVFDMTSMTGQNLVIDSGQSI